MDAIAGLRTTGRRVVGPTADLVEVRLEDGSKQTALVFHPEYRDTARWGEVEGYRPFLAAPGVDGLCPLLRHDPDEGLFLYRTGPCWSMAEVVRVFSDLGAAAGIRAGLELCYLVGQVLVDAAEAGERWRLTAHGALDPRRVVFGPQGTPGVIGYGLPAFDFVDQLDGRRPRDEDTVRYAAPELFERVPPDLTSDLFTLALLGVELSLGRPLYDGLAEDIRRQASRGEAIRRLYRWREVLPDAVLEAYAQALKPDHDARYRSGMDFVYAFHDLLGSLDADGPSLAETMARFRSQIQRGREFRGGTTGALTRAELLELAADLEADEAQPLPPPRRPRPVEPVEEPEPADARWVKLQRDRDEPLSARDRLKQRLQKRDEGLSARDRLVANLRNRTSGGGSLGRPRRAGGPADARAAEAPVPRPPADVPAGARSVEAPPPPPEALAPAPPSEGLSVPPPSSEPPSRSAVEPAPADPDPTGPDPTGPDPAAEAPPPLPERAPEAMPPALVPELVPLDERVTLTVLVEGRAERVELPAALTLGEAATVVATRLGVPTIDLLGQVQAWPVLAPDGPAWPHGTTLDDLPPDARVHLGLVPARTVRLTVEVAGEPPLRFAAPVAVHLPAGVIVAHLRRWLALPEGRWSARLNGVALHPEQLVAELAPADGAILELIR